MTRRVWVVAVHEYLGNVKRREFILVTLGLPVLMLLMAAISLIGAGAMISQLLKNAPHAIAVVDRKNVLKLPADGELLEGMTLAPCSSLDVGRRLLASGRYTTLLDLDGSYLSTGRLTIYRASGASLFGGDAGPQPGALLTRALLARLHVPKAILERALHPVSANSDTWTYNKRTHKFTRQTGAGQVAKFAVPYIFGILLMTSIFFSANYLLRGIADEKENRVIEVILSAVSPDELLRGKLLGSAGVGLTQVAVWALLGLVPAAAMLSSFIHITVLQVLLIGMFFLLGYGLYATMMAGLGVLGTSYRETQQLAGMVSMLAVIPFLLLTLILQYPNGLVARLLGFFPFTAPVTMVLRISTGESTPIDAPISALLIAATTWLLLKLSTRLFRFGLLIYGKRPGFAETVRWLRQT